MIDPDTRRIAKRFAGSSPSFPKLIAAVEKAEGNIVKAVECSMTLDPARDKREQALDITCRSAVHAMSDFIREHHAEEYVQYWAKRWAPVGAANDPTGLNRNWPINTVRFWLGYTE
jgi:hypothetical protein